ncbi:MAG: enolase C-terminal domain-like protein [Polyangiales bacterium]
MKLNARVDVVKGDLGEDLVGPIADHGSRSFVVLTLTDEDGVVGVGEGSPLPGYSPDTTEDAANDLRDLLEEPLEARASISPRALLEIPEAQLMQSPAARFALETALLDWLGKVRDKPAHVLVAHGPVAPVPVAHLVMEANAESWERRADRLVARGATHLKFKVGQTFAAEVEALRKVRASHPALTIRLDGNRRIALEEFQLHVDALSSLDLEFIEEPVPESDLLAAASLGLPLALDESLRDETSSRSLLPSPHVVAAVIKPTVLGGFSAALELADIAREHDAEPVLSHTFEGPIGQAACAELSLALQTRLAAGLGTHPCLLLWPTHRIAAMTSGDIQPHDAPGLGLEFEDVYDA